jgi:hypothetical protein
MTKAVSSSSKVQQKRVSNIKKSLKYAVSEDHVAKLLKISDGYKGDNRVAVFLDLLKQEEQKQNRKKN